MITGQCAKCNRGGPQTVDHIHSISDGGKNGRENRQLLCYDCHRLKTKIFNIKRNELGRQFTIPESRWLNQCFLDNRYRFDKEKLSDGRPRKIVIINGWRGDPGLDPQSDQDRDLSHKLDGIISVAAVQGDNYAKLYDTLKVASMTLSEHKILALRAVLAQGLKSRFIHYGGTRKHNPKYGNLNRNFSDEELRAFFSAITPELYPKAWKKYKLFFKFQAYLGLRIGEVCNVKESDIDKTTRELMLKTEKAKRLDRLLIPKFLMEEITVYLEENKDRIAKLGGIVFFSEESSKCIELNYMRKVFREISESVDLKAQYGQSTETFQNRKARTLHRLTSHSLRHYAITRFYESCKDPVLTNAFARHAKTDMAATMTYIGTQRDAVYTNVDRAFDKDVLEESHS